MMLAARDATRPVALVYFIALICAGHVEVSHGAVSLEGSDDSLCRPQQANTHNFVFLSHQRSSPWFTLPLACLLKFCKHVDAGELCA